MPKYRKAVLALIGANLIWGAASPIFKFALQNISPFTLPFIRFYGASLILLIISYPRLKIAKKDTLKLILLSIFGVSIHISFYFLGLRLSPSINAPIISASGPVFLYIASIFILHEKPHLKVLAGIVISLLGVLIIIGQPIFENRLDGQLLGNMFIFIAMLAAIAHAIISKEIIADYSPAALTFWMSFIGALTFLPFASYEIYTGQFPAQLDYRGIIGIIYGIFFSSATAYTLFEYGIKYMEAQDTGVFSYLDPIAAIIIALPLLGEKITPVFFIGSFLVFGGILLAEGKIKHHPHHRFHKR